MIHMISSWYYQQALKFILGNILNPELLSAQLAVAQQGAQYNQFLNPYLSLFPSGGLNAYTGKI